MYIKEITSRSRRDFTAIYRCGYCEHEAEGHGYDDTYFHERVVPNMVCAKCGKKSDGTDIPLDTKYPDHVVI